MRVMVVGEGLFSASLRTLRAALRAFSRFRSSRTLVEVSHPSPDGQDRESRELDFLKV
ncbi:hypothetical protein TUM12370_16750 [Salmonella enterica subsp. enterica serovar Choleraesuis]|nr:hypothetical protein TUM12370_16750 [Salmonella enterica subsp. enterica serovar Choleraesuis]